MRVGTPIYIYLRVRVGNLIYACGTQIGISCHIIIILFTVYFIETQKKGSVKDEDPKG